METAASASDEEVPLPLPFSPDMELFVPDEEPGVMAGVVEFEPEEEEEDPDDEACSHS